MLGTVDFSLKLTAPDQMGARVDGSLALLVQRGDQTDRQLADHESRLDTLERGRWPLPSIAPLVVRGASLCPCGRSPHAEPQCPLLRHAGAGGSPCRSYAAPEDRTSRSASIASTISERAAGPYTAILRSSSNAVSYKWISLG